MRPHRVLLYTVSLAAILQILAMACSWDRPIWPKDKRSDTPLFRFVTKLGAGYINASGRVIISPRFRVFGNHGYDDFFEGVASVQARGAIHIDSKGAPIR